MIYWNSSADEMDAVAMMYPPGTEKPLWIFREQFEEMGTTIDDIGRLIGPWVLNTMTMYPMSNVVETYCDLYGPKIPDGLEPDFE